MTTHSITFCRRIELDFDNNRILRSFRPYIDSDDWGIRLIETESINECTRRARGDNPAQYRYIGTRYVYRVEDEKKFFLLLIQTGVQYKEVNPNSYSMSDEGND